LKSIAFYLKKVFYVIKNEGFIIFINILVNKFQIWLTYKIQTIFWFSKKNNTKKSKIVIMTGVPYDDVGGGQRAAQLTRVALQVGWDVLYIYLYPRFDFEKKVIIQSKINIRRLIHKHFKNITSSQLLKSIDQQTIIVFEIPHPSFIGFLRIAKLRGITTVFELIDDWETSLGGDWFKQEVLDEFIRQCDFVIGTAQILVEKIHKKGRKDAIYLPNAANEYIFDYFKSYPKPRDIPEGKNLLYFGSLYGEWFGWEYIRETALINPDLNICLIGDAPPKIRKEFSNLSKNIYFLGSKKIEVLPNYIHHSEGCILPFRPSQISEAVSPIKVFEYLFMNKPVISTKIKELEGLPNVYTANDPKKFASLCSQLDDLKEFPQKSIDEFTSKNSWLSRLQTITGIKGKKNISAIVLIHNNRDIIERCIGSLLWNCSSYLTEVIVVDNASDDDGGNFIKALFPNIVLLKNPVNGCSSGRNLGTQNANGNILAFFDSDQWFTSAFGFEEALTILKNNAQIGAVGWAAGWFDHKNETLGGQIVDYLPNRGMTARAIEDGFRTDIGYLGTGGMFIPCSIFEATGGFDVNLDPTTFEDTDLSFAIKKLGFELAYRNLSGIRHQPHSTTSASKRSKEYQQLFQRNSNYFKSKWRDYPSYFKETK
jgi:GT2 family glycosyltransferase/glycosyltransferase involved in cell wall biosynthesis